MPRSSPIQTDFSGGELGPLVDGRTDIEKYNKGAEIIQNYIPTLEGPLIRTPGTKRVAPVKDPSKPPRFIPFKISNKEQYLLEFGENYIRFFTDQGQVITSGTSYVVSGNMSIGNGYLFETTNIGKSAVPFRATRSTTERKPYEIPAQSFYDTVYSSVVSGTILEIPTFYDYNMIQNIGFTQKGNTLWIMHSSLPTYTLQKFGSQDWDYKYFQTVDGPYLPLNSYLTEGDFLNKKMRVEWNRYFPTSTFEQSRYHIRCYSHSSVKVVGIVNNGGSAEVRTASPHGFSPDERVYVHGVAGTTEVNNGTSIPIANSVYELDFLPQESSTWQIKIISSTSFVLVDSVYSNAYTGSGIVRPAIFNAEDAGRNIGLYIGGHRYAGVISTGSNLLTVDTASGNSRYPHPVYADVNLFEDTSLIPVASTIVNVWQMGAHCRKLGWPSSGAFHQNRFVTNSGPGRPTEFNASETGAYASFALSEASSLVVTDKNALQFSLVSESNDQLQWVKSGIQGLYFGTQSIEFLVAPSKDGQALTPTNVNSDIVGTYGSAGIDPVRFGDSIIYIQNSQRKVRELRFFANLQSHKSTQINQLSDHIGLPGIAGLAIQKESTPMVWGYTTDGTLISMSYARDDSQFTAGWARHILGGKSDSAGSAPKVKAIGVMRDSTGVYDQLWMAVQRYINGTSTVEVEYMTEPYRHRDPTQKPRDAFYLSCGATYDSSLVITNITTGSALVTITNHGLARNDKVLVTDVVGMNSSYVNSDGVVFNSNIVNERVFLVGSTTANTFFLQDFNSSIILTDSYSPYFSGGKVRKLVSSIGGLTWLKNETVDILGDGGIQGTAVVNSAGVVALTNPAAVVQIGYSYKSRLKTLVKDSGSQTGSAIGMQRKTIQLAFKIKDVGDLAYGGISFDQLHKADFGSGDNLLADASVPIYSGIYRDGIEQDIGFYGQVFVEQSSPLPGMIQSITYLMDEFDL